MKKTDVTTQTKWSLDSSHSEIEFKVRHLMISHVKGGFKTFNANIYTTLNDFTTADIDLWIDASSITTGDANRDEHLKSPDFFDAQRYKQITFISKSIEKSDTSMNHDLWGELTIKEITKNIKLNVEFGGIINDPWGKERAGFTVTGKINRADFGLTWNTIIETGGVMVGDEVSFTCEMELTKADEKNLTMEMVSEAEKKGMIDEILIVHTKKDL